MNLESRQGVVDYSETEIKECVEAEILGLQNEARKKLIREFGEIDGDYSEFEEFYKKFAGLIQIDFKLVAKYFREWGVGFLMNCRNISRAEIDQILGIETDSAEIIYFDLRKDEALARVSLRGLQKKQPLYFCSKRCCLVCRFHEIFIFC